MNENSNIKVHSLSFIAVFFVFLSVYLAKDIILPVLMAGFIAIILSPLIDLLEKAKIPRLIAILCSFALVVLVLNFAGTALSQSLSTLSSSDIDWAAKLDSALASLPIPADLLPTKDSIGSAISSLNSESGLLGLSKDIFLSFRVVVSKSFFIILLCVFLLMEKNLFAEKIRKLTRETSGATLKISEFFLSVKHYVLIKTLTSLATGILVGGFLYFRDVELAFLFGFLAFALNFIPTIGSILAAIPAILFALVQIDFQEAAMVAAAYLVVNVLIGSVLEPRVMGRGLGISPAIVILSLLFWGWLLGPIGMFLSIPLTVMIKIASKNSNKWHFISVILSDRE